MLTNPAGPFDLTQIPVQLSETTNSFPLLAIPFFILAGSIMSRGGMSQRLIDLARAIVGRQKYILYDEPTTGLDPVNANVINRLIARLQGEIGATSVIVTHDIESAFYLGDRIVLMFDGRVQAQGTPTELRESPDPIVQEFLHPKLT